jgi:hypothetical protein
MPVDMARTAIYCAATGDDVIYEGSRLWCATVETAKEKLREHGVAVLLNALDKDGVQKMQDGMWDTLGWMSQNMETPIVRGDPKTYATAREFAPNHGALFQGWRGLAHRQHIWDAREAAALAFAEIWGCAPEELLCSFDATSMGIVHLAEPSSTGWERGNVWLHVDQSPTRPEFECVQSWISGEDVEAGDATLRVMPGTHLQMREFAEHFGITETKDWYKLTAEERAWFAEQGYEDIRIMAPAGSLVLWDSRLVHSGAAPLREAQNQKPRNVVYVCMQPRHVTVRGMDQGMEKRRLTTKEMKTLETTLKKRRAIFDPTNDSRFLRMTTHWPRKVLLFGTFPRSYGPKPESWSKVPTGEMPKLTSLQRRLAGLD